MKTTITGKNQVTLPAQLVHELGWRSGMRLEWEKLDDSAVVARVVPSRGDVARRALGLVRLPGDADPFGDLRRMRDEESAP